MDVTEARHILEKIKFLDFKFEIRNVYMGHQLVMRVNAPDTRDRTKKIPLIHEAPLFIDNMRDENDLIFTVFEFVTNALKHEAAELFTVGGQDVFNEHHTDNVKQEKWNIIREMFTTKPDGQTGRIIRKDCR